MKNTRKYRWFYWAFMLGMMIIIFVLSHQPGTVSTKISDHVASTLQVESQEKYFYKAVSAQPLFAGLSLRKYAHLVLYGGLGLSTFLVTKDGRVSGKKKFWLAMAICFVYSCTDELHQYFIPGRGAKLIDIIIDAIGYSVVIGLGWLVLRIKRRKQ